MSLESYKPKIPCGPKAQVLKYFIRSRTIPIGKIWSLLIPQSYCNKKEMQSQTASGWGWSECRSSIWLNALNTGTETGNKVTSAAALGSYPFISLSFPTCAQKWNISFKVKWKILVYTEGVVGFWHEKRKGLCFGLMQACTSFQFFSLTTHFLLTRRVC